MNETCGYEKAMTNKKKNTYNNTALLETHEIVGVVSYMIVRFYT